MTKAVPVDWSVAKISAISLILSGALIQALNRLAPFLGRRYDNLVISRRFCDEAETFAGRTSLPAHPDHRKSLLEHDGIYARGKAIYRLRDELWCPPRRHREPILVLRVYRFCDASVERDVRARDVEWSYNVPNSATDRSQRRESPCRGRQHLKLLGYADDLVIYSTSASGLQRSLELLNETFGELALKINEEKTENPTMPPPHLSPAAIPRASPS